MEALLVSWLGRTDLRAIAESDLVGIGPVAQALATGRFARLELLCDGNPDEADAYLKWLRAQTQAEVNPHFVALPSPTDFDAIYRHARAVVAEVAAEVDTQLTYHLSPGTPAMAAVWIILAKTRFPAELIESSIQHGVRTVSVPFQISADFIPDLLARPDAELTRLTAGLPPAAPAFDAIIHQSPVMQRVVARARRVALRSIPVLIEGESGTGKELLARAIHQASLRRDRPMITVNCGAIAPELIESELFGHEKGAFTGAVARKRGRFELADGGTIFLDEIGELSPGIQSKLLRVLEEKKLTRVGGVDLVDIDVRIVAATNRPMKQDVKDGKFREDLFFRLNVFPIEMPTLSERREDIIPLAEYFLKKQGYRFPTLSEAVRNLLLAYDWPGNIRELRNAMERAAILAGGEEIAVEDFSLEIDDAPLVEGEIAAPAPATGQGLESTEKKMIVDALARAGGNKTEAAKLLKITRRRLYSRMKVHGIQP